MQSAVSHVVAPADRAPTTGNALNLGALLLLLAGLWFILCRHVSLEWRFNEQYNYGWFVPFLALFLFWLRWEKRPQPEIRSRNKSEAQVAVGLAALALFLLLPIRLFELSNPGWRALDWTHSIVVVTLTLLIVWYTGGKSWLRHFAFPIAFFFVAVPWISPIESPVVQGLMKGVAAIVAEGMNAFGIPAQVQGSVIRVNAGIVGVNEACSGVRSLQTSLMMAFLFGELKHLITFQRVCLIAAAFGVAFLANVGRAFFLVWVAASSGMDAMERQHDIAGYAVLGVLFAGTLGLATWLARMGQRDTVLSPDRVRPQDTPGGRMTVRKLPTSVLVTAMCWLVAVDCAAEGWYRWHERQLVSQPQWTVRWPEQFPGFRNIQFDERTRRMLRFDDGRAVAFPLRHVSDATSPSYASFRNDTVLLYFFRWHPGHNSALLASLHRPDVCLPTTGWEQIADNGAQLYDTGTDLAVPFRHFEFRSRAPMSNLESFAHAFYCLWEDRLPPKAEQATSAGGAHAKWSRDERLQLVLNGRRHLGQQVMELVISSPHKISNEEAQARFAELVRRLIVKPATPEQI